MSVFLKSLCLFVLLTVPVPAFAAVSCDNDDGEVMLTEQTINVDCYGVWAHSTNNRGYPVNMASCIEILESECGGAEADCTPDGAVKRCLSEVGGCNYYGNSYYCHCYDGSRTTCELQSIAVRNQSCISLTRTVCPAIEPDSHCEHESGACWVYSAGFICQCSNGVVANLGDFDDPADAVDLISEKGCEGLLDRYCHDSDPSCPAEAADRCRPLIARQLACDTPPLQGQFVDLGNCCAIAGSDDPAMSADYLACVEREACHAPAHACRDIFDIGQPGDGDLPDPGSHPSDGDTPDGDALTDDEGNADSDSGADENGGCESGQAAWPFALMLLVAVLMRLRRV